MATIGALGRLSRRLRASSCSSWPRSSSGAGSSDSCCARLALVAALARSSASSAVRRLPGVACQPRGSGDARVFVPSPRFYREALAGASARSIADAYWLYDDPVLRRAPETATSASTPSRPMLDLVTTLSPHFKQAYFFGRLRSARRRPTGHRLRSPQARLPREPRRLALPGLPRASSSTPSAASETRSRSAAQWYEKAARCPAHLPSVPRLAAALCSRRADEREKAIAMWAQVYGQGDKYSREKAVTALERLLPTGPQTAREQLTSAQAHRCRPAGGTSSSSPTSAAGCLVNAPGRFADVLVVMAASSDC